MVCFLENKCSQEIPRNLFIKRDELLEPNCAEPIYDFDNGVASSIQMKSFRGTCVAVRHYETDITGQVKAVLSLPSHPCLPLVMGICCDYQPYLIVTKFYGISRFGVMITLAAALKGNNTRKITTAHWLSILKDIAQGLLHMHMNGFCHGDLQAYSIILHRKWATSSILQPVFINLERATPSLNKDNSKAIASDIKMFGCIVESIRCMIDPVACESLGAITEMMTKVPELSRLMTDIVVCLNNICVQIH